MVRRVTVNNADSFNLKKFHFHRLQNFFSKASGNKTKNIGISETTLSKMKRGCSLDPEVKKDEVIIDNDSEDMKEFF